MPEQITLYTAKVCPFAHRVEIALAEAKVSYTRYEIDLQNKPEWYAPKVNPASKVPAIAYGGPPVPPDQPSPESVKLAESLVLVEFIGDLFPESGVVPKDPVKRAQARFFVEGVSSKFFPAYFSFVRKSGSAADFIKALEYLQSLLPAEGFAVGEFSLADIAIAPFLGRARVFLVNNIGQDASTGEGAKLWDTITTNNFARLGKYINDLFQRESYVATFDEEVIASRFKRA